MSNSTQALLGFIAALMHDVRKIDLNEKGRWEDHEDLRKTVNPLLKPGEIDFVTLLSADVVDIAMVHHAPTDLLTALVATLSGGKQALPHALDEGPTARAKLALLMADRWQKSMYQTKERSEFQVTLANPSFYPFYGSMETWNVDSSASALRDMARVLSRAEYTHPEYPARLSLRNLMEAQESLRRFPHTTYIPYDSLAIHHRFVALLFLFIYRKLLILDSPLDLRGLDFSLVRITPDPLALLYRLRDVGIAEQAMTRLGRALFDAVFKEYTEIVPDLSWNLNPFEFFGLSPFKWPKPAGDERAPAGHRGDDIVLVIESMPEQRDRLLNVLQTFVENDPILHSVQVEWLDFHLPDGWGQDGEGRLSFKGNPAHSPVYTTTSVCAKALTVFPSTAERLCQRCHKPVLEPVLTHQGEWLCQECLAERQAGRDRRYLLEKFDDLMGFVFLSVALPLREHAVQKAQAFIQSFVSRKRLQPEWISPGAQGFFEYLDAVHDLDEFRTAVVKRVEETKDNRDGAFVLFTSSTQLALVLRWELCWPFVDWLNFQRRESLELDTSLTVVFAHPKMPFWSLMDRFAKYNPRGDIYYDTTGRSVMMFTDTEVNTIRQLAIDARSEKVGSAQLHSLLQLALTTEFHELELELDARAQEQKMGRTFPGKLKAGLGKLEYHPTDDADRRREKRALFIKYIARLKGDER